MTPMELELTSDTEMHLFIEKGMRGDISYICKKFSGEKNKSIKCYDNSQESKFIIYLDANILHSSAMSRYLPIVDLNG